MDKIKVAILFGGKSGEHEVSIASALSVYEALDKSKFEVTLIAIDKEGRWFLPDSNRLLSQKHDPLKIKLNASENKVSILPFRSEGDLVPVGANSGRNSSSHFDVVFPVLHGPFGEDGTVQGLFDLAEIPYVGAGVLGSAIGMDKDVAKRLLSQAQIPVVPFQVVKRYAFEKAPEVFLAAAQKEFGYPYFVKPANMGSSVGVSKVKSVSEALEKFREAFKYDTKVLVEKAISARELEVAVLGFHEPKASIIGEIIPRHEFYSYEAKYLDDQGADLKIPAENLSEETAKAVQKYAVEAFQVLECTGMARVDFFLDKMSGEIYLNEINTIPGFTKISMYPKMWAASGVPYPKLLEQLIAFAFERHKERYKNIALS